MTMGIKDLIQLLREDGLNCVAGELSTGELQYLAADALLAYEKENAILKYKIECHVETILQYKEEKQKAEAEVEQLKTNCMECVGSESDLKIANLQAENAKLRELLESHAPEGHNYTNQQYANLRAENAKLKGENYRLNKLAKMAEAKPSILGETLVKCEKLRAENAKLRQMFDKVVDFIQWDQDGGCPNDYCEKNCLDKCDVCNQVEKDGYDDCWRIFLEQESAQC